MADFALPTALSISDVRRNGMPAVRRTVIHGSTSQNTYGPGELVYVPIETGSAGSFFMTETSRLCMTVTVYNKNLFTDFMNLPRCGANVFIEELGLEVHNSLNENQRFYAEMIEQEMIRNGENQVPFEMTISNPLEPGGGLAGDLHCNLIKPSMITTTGLPHGIRYAVLKQPLGSNVASTVPDIISEGILLNGHGYLKRPYGRNGYGTIADLGLVDPANGLTAQFQSGGFVGLVPPAVVGGVPNPVLRDQFGWWAETNMPCSSSYDDRLNGSFLRTVRIPTDGVTAQGDLGGDDWRIVTSNVPSTAGNRTNADLASLSALDNQVFKTNRFIGTAAGGNEVRRYAFNYPRISAFGSNLSDNTMFDVHYGQTLGGYTPMMWPAKQSTDIEKFLRYVRMPKGINTKNVHNYLANCKNIPIGVAVNLTDDPYGARALWKGDDATGMTSVPTTTDPRGERYSFRVSLQLYSCLLGVFAHKWFPSLLIGAGRMRLRFRLQQPNIAMQTLMDPCRIVPGTGRDRYPYLGIAHTGTKTVGTIVNADVGVIAHGIHPIMVQNYVPGLCYNNLVAIGRFPVPQLRMKMATRPNTFMTTLTVSDGNNRQQLAARIADGSVMGASSLNGATGTNYRTYTEFLNLASFDDQAGTYNWKRWSTAGFIAPIESADNVVGNINTAIQALQFRTIRNLEAVVNTLSKSLEDLSDNVVFGYPSTVLSKINLDGTEYIDPVLVPNTGPGVSTFDLNNVNYLTGGEHQSTSLTARADHILRPPTFSSPIFAHQNFFTQTNYNAYMADTATDALRRRTGFADYQNVARVRPIWCQDGQKYPVDLHLQGMNWDIYAAPQPQYVPVLRPWDKSVNRTFTEANPAIGQQSEYANESQLCYGTHLKRSVAQVRRSNKNLFLLNMDGDHAPTAAERPTYTVSEISYRVEELILPESASMQIIASAMEGGITMEADMIKSVEQILPQQANQKILINVSAGVVNDICFVFQPTEMLNGDKAYGYNSFAFYCPWTSFKFQKQSTGTVDGTVPQPQTVNAVPTTPDNYNYLGGEPNYYNALMNGENIGINCYMSIATEYFPRNPIDDLQTLIDHVTWGDQRRGDVEYLGLTPCVQNSYDSTNFTVISPFQDGFFSVFTPIECLDDQTITDNPFWTPLECNIKKLIRGKRAAKPALPFYKPLEGTFHLALNLQAFMGQQDRMNVGSPMVNNNSYLNMQNCHLLANYECRMLVFIRVFARVVIERGGIIQIFT